MPNKPWKDFERVIAATWGSFRAPLSGANSRHNGGDVLLPEGVRNVLIECKTRARAEVLTMHRLAQQDAKRNGVDPGHTILCIKQKGAHGYFVVVTDALFEKIQALPGFLELFR